MDNNNNNNKNNNNNNDKNNNSPPSDVDELLDGVTNFFGESPLLCEITAAQRTEDLVYGGRRRQRAIQYAQMPEYERERERDRRS